jgi:hypothetical protein
MGEIISLQDNLYQFELPDMPPERDMLFADAPKKEQYWKTKHSQSSLKWFTPDGGIKNVKSMPEKERQEYINFWRAAWKDGLWFLNNGEPTYLTGSNVDHLCFNKFKSGYFYFLQAQKERFYFRELTNKNPLCDGRVWVKGRRVGITAEQITEAIRVLISDFGNHIGIQSDESKKTKATLIIPIIDAYVKRPSWMREHYYTNNGRVPREKLELTDAVIKEDGDDPLGGTCTGFPSTSKAMDGYEFMLIVMDEFSKWVESLPYETFEINKKTIINPGKRGKADILSTTGDSKEAAKAVKDWHKLIADSNPKILNENGQTNSGLWHYFVSYIYSFELIEKMAGFGLHIKDKYGNINKEMAEEFIWKDIKKHPKDSKEYIFALYKAPMEMRHALLTPTGQGYFNKIRITNRLDELRALPNDRKPYVIGSLEYDQHGNVYFESNAEREVRCEKEGIDYVVGHWMIAIHPYFSVERGIDTRNRVRKINGVYFPPVNAEFAFGYDPVRYKKEDTSSNSLSKASIIVAKKFDYFGAGDANRYAALYLFRPDDPNDAHKECIKAAKYWGMAGHHERVIESVKSEFTDANCLPLLLKNPKDDLYGMWIDSQGKVVKNALDSMVARFSPPKTEEDVDQIGEMPFEDCLVDMDGFDIGNTTMFDTFMAMIELDYAMKQLVFTNLTDDSVIKKMKVVNEIFPKRN